MFTVKFETRTNGTRSYEGYECEWYQVVEHSDGAAEVNFTDGSGQKTSKKVEYCAYIENASGRTVAKIPARAGKGNG